MLTLQFVEPGLVMLRQSLMLLQNVQRALKIMHHLQVLVLLVIPAAENLGHFLE